MKVGTGWRLRKWAGRCWEEAGGPFVMQVLERKAESLFWAWKNTEVSMRGTHCRFRAQHHVEQEAR